VEDRADAAQRTRAVRGGFPSDAGQPLVGIAESPWHLLLAFGALALAAVAHSGFDAYEGRPWASTILPSAIMVLQVVVLTLGHRWMKRRHAGRFVMLVAGVIVSVFFGTLVFQLHTDPGLGLKKVLTHGFVVGLTVGGFWVLVVLLPAIVRDANLRSLAAHGVRRDAELAQLRSSLQPHFLLNTLHAIAALTVDEPLVARRLLSALGDLLRDALEAAPELRPLADDLNWLRRYADILEVRHRGSLSFEWDISPETTAALLPKLLLQPLLENAVKHGALRRAAGGVVILRAHLVDTSLRLVVDDNGPGFAPRTKDGLGLRILRERISLAHPRASLHIQSSSDGTRATIDIPYAPGTGSGS
jgi:signal transduction histidine kinase